MIEELIKLNDEQKRALELLHSGGNVFLTGKAGTGKSTVLRRFQAECNRECVFLAPTGIAAINIDGATIHSFFQLKPALLTPDSIEEISNKRRIKMIREVETIVIDEVSMVRSDLFAAIDKRLRQITHNGSPFGGKQIILVGDFFQLPPVVKTETESDYLNREFGGHYAFQTNLWQEADFQCICLQTNQRQKDDKTFMFILNDLRYGKLAERNLKLDEQSQSVNVIEALTQLCVERPPLKKKIIYLCTTNREADRINQLNLSNLKGEEHLFRAVVQGKFPDSDYPTPEALSLKVGARVMTLTNKRTPDGEIEYVNGEIGIIEAFGEGEDSTVRVRLDRGSTVSIQRTEWIKYEYELERDENTGKDVIRQHEVGKFVQIPLKLAYAITIHKSQGLSLDCVEVKLGNGCFATGQLYTALSRCRSIQNLRIDRAIYPEDAITDPDVIAFYRSIEGDPKPEHKNVSMSIPEEDVEAVRAFLAQLHSKKTAASPSNQGHAETDPLDSDLSESESDSTENEVEAEQLPDEPKVTSSPDIDHLIIVYRNQSGDERYQKTSNSLNGIGFNKMDAPVLTPLAEKYLTEGYLTKSEVAIVHRLIQKYRKQWS